MILVHAMDQMIYDIAVSLNDGALRVPNVSTYRPFFMAPGFDSNPLVPPSNPRDVAQRINDGVEEYRKKTLVGRNQFLVDLEDSGRASASQVQDWYLKDPTGLVVVALIDSDRVEAHYQRSGGPYSADEFVTERDESVKRDTYELLRNERHEIDAGRYSHSLVKVEH